MPKYPIIIEKLNKLREKKAMEFLCERLPQEDLGLLERSDALKVKREDCPDCPRYETCKSDGYLEAIDKELGLIPAERHEKPVKQGVHPVNEYA